MGGAAGGGAGRRLKAAAPGQPHLEMQRIVAKVQQQQADEAARLKRKGGIAAGVAGDGGTRGAKRWALVRRALDSGRLLRLPYAAENYSIVTSTFK